MDNGSQPIHHACMRGHLELVQWLVQQQGASLSAQDRKGDQPVDWARVCGHMGVVEWLVEQAVSSHCSTDPEGSQSEKDETHAEAEAEVAADAPAEGDIKPASGCDLDQVTMHTFTAMTPLQCCNPKHMVLAVFLSRTRQKIPPEWCNP